MKKITTLILLLLLIILGIWFVLTKLPKNQSGEDQMEIEENSINKEVSFAFESSEKNISTDFYNIEIKFPVVEDDYVASKIDEYVEKTSKQFRDDAEEFGPHPVAGRKYSLFVNFEFKDSEEYKTFVFLTSVDMGGAHPNHFFKTLTFDKDGEVVTVTDFVQRKFDDLGVFSKISEVVQKKLREDLGEIAAESSWIEKGAGNNPENFEDFYVSKDAVHFLFEPYAVAAYALSSREVEVRFDEINL